MLTIRHKADILRKAGVAVPSYPADIDLQASSSSWTHAIETLYVTYAAARAAKSLRDAEEARQLAMLRLMSATARA